MPSSDVLELDSILYVPNLTKSLLSVSCMIDLQCLAKFDGQQVTITNFIHGYCLVLARGMREGGFYRLLTDPLEQLWKGAMEEGFSSFEETIIELIMELVIDSFFVDDGNWKSTRTK
jgi:hypothetical protein